MIVPCVEQHVGQRVTHLSRGPEHVEVVAIRKNPPATPEHAIHRSREARADRLHAAGEIAPTPGLDDQVDVIGLHRVLGHPEALLFARSRQTAFQLPCEPHRAKRRQPAPDLQRHVAREARGEGRSSAMRVSSIQARLSAGALASSTPTRHRAQRQGELPRRVIPARHARAS